MRPAIWATVTIAMLTTTACPASDDGDGAPDATPHIDASPGADAPADMPDAAVNIDECAAGTDDCDADATCTDLDPGYSCTCHDGYAGDGTTCTDIDECTAGTDDCDANATCTNTSGAYTCACNEGFKGDGVSCEDIDECPPEDDPCDAHAICENVVGGFTCTCEPGYTGDGFTCADVDECALGTHSCDSDATCTDTDGGFTCACNDGFSGTGFVCEDVDECALGTDDCDINATCTDTEGSFTCACNEGFTGDGTSCTGVLGYGAPCSEGIQCASGLCIGEPYDHCSELCNQAIANHCPDVGASGFCVPIGGGEFACVGSLSLGIDDEDAIVSPGDSVTRSLNTLSDADLFQVPVTDGMFDLVATPVGNHDVQLEVFDSIGQPIGVVNHEGPGTAEAATLTSSGGAGVIFCIVRNAGTTTGSYTFAVTAR